MYGFRISEPQHDGTPHWHLLIFAENKKLKIIQNTIKSYALKDSSTEKGALKNRVNFKTIDPSKGSAAGYIAKYVAKNIDGLAVGNDLFGNPAMETSLRVETWATTWNIRQFQQIGGAPVTVWRELRRVKEMDEKNPDHLIEAWKSANKNTKKIINGNEIDSVSWGGYINAQGGPVIGNKYKIRVSKQDQDGLGRYGEPLGERPIGVEAYTNEKYTPKHMEWMTIKPLIDRTVTWFCHSNRHKWVIKKSALCAPWTRVNNCTQSLKKIDRPGHQDDRPGHQDDRPGHQDYRPGHQDDRPGHQDDRQGHQDDKTKRKLYTQKL